MQLLAWFLLLSSPAASVELQGIDVLGEPEWCATDSATSGIERCSQWNRFPEHGIPDGWTGLGWMRWVLEVEPQLLGKPFALVVAQIGAVDVFVDGSLVASIGTVGVNSSRERSQRIREPLVVVFASNARESHELAFRYSSFVTQHPWWKGLGPALNFAIEPITPGSLDVSSSRTEPWRFVLLGLMLAFTALHVLLFFFERRERANLYFAALSASSAMSIFFLARLNLWSTVPDLTFSVIAFRLSLLVLNLSFLSFVHTFTGVGRWRIRLLYGVAGVLIFAWVLIRPFQSGLPVMLFCLSTIPEVFWCFSSYNKSPRAAGDAGWLISVGALPLLFSGLIQILVMLDLIEEPPDPLADPFLAIAFLMIAMSIFLARRFALTGRDLEGRLVEIERLSSETLRQEIERARLEAENRRKSVELDEARELQLSMLPEELPKGPRWQIAARMETAVEVGGDFYDFHVDSDEKLTAVLGDATGHGLQAGIMVAATKALFKAYRAHDPDSLLAEMSRAIHGMGLSRRLMSFLVLRLHGSELTIASAGMPPVLIRRSSGEVDEISLAALPLGARAMQIYPTRTEIVGKGDLIIAATDGLPEATGPDGELFGYERLRELVAEMSYEPSEAIERMVKSGERWRQGPLTDDQTLLAIRILED